MGYHTAFVDLLLALRRNLDKSIAEKIDFAGGNTGNLIFTENARKQIQYEKEIWLNINALKEVPNPTVIIPSANFIHQGEDGVIPFLIRFLEGTDCPVTLAGLGTQAAEDVTPAQLVSRLGADQIRTFKMVSERAVSIGVRGEYTAECLNKMGIYNVRVIGCPSFYFRKKGQSHRLKIPSLRKVQMTVTPGDGRETLVLDIGMRMKALWLVQMMTERPDLVMEQDAWNPQVGKQIEDFRKKYFEKLPVTDEELWNYMHRNCRIFFDKEEWDSFYDREDITFSFGSRFHGNMAAFQNGVTALWLTHDVRTRELTETLHLPHITYRQLSEIKDPQELIEYCDYSDYERHYDRLYDGYMDFLRENNIELKQSWAAS